MRTTASALLVLLAAPALFATAAYAQTAPPVIYNIDLNGDASNDPVYIYRDTNEYGQITSERLLLNDNVELWKLEGDEWPSAVDLTSGSTDGSESHVLQIAAQYANDYYATWFALLKSDGTPGLIGPFEGRAARLNGDNTITLPFNIGFATVERNYVIDREAATSTEVKRDFYAFLEEPTVNADEAMTVYPERTKSGGNKVKKGAEVSLLGIDMSSAFKEGDEGMSSDAWIKVRSGGKEGWVSMGELQESAQLPMHD